MKHKCCYQVFSVIGFLLVCIVYVTLLTLAIQFVFELTTHIIGSSMTFSEWSKNDMGIICTDIIPSLGLILLCLWKFNGKKIISHSCSNFSTAYVPYIIILGICTYFPIGVIEDIICLPDYLMDDFEKSVFNPYEILLICLIGPFVEELLFRGVVLKRLLIYMNNVYSAIISSAVLFALFHVNPAQIPGALILGLITGYIVYRTKSIFYSFFVHAIYNSLCCLQYFAIGYESKTIDLVNGNWYIYLLLAISSLGIGYFVVKTMNFKLSLIKK